MRLPCNMHIISPPNVKALPATANRPKCWGSPTHQLTPCFQLDPRVWGSHLEHQYTSSRQRAAERSTAQGSVFRLMTGGFAELSIRTHVISILSHCSTLLLLGGSISIYFNPRIHFTVDVLTWLSTYCFGVWTQLISPPSHDWECDSINVELLSSWSSGL